jgi:hypothetical protein
MKRTAILFFLAALVLNTYSQEENLQFKLDSIVKEADLLYRYEKAVWISTDLLMADKKLKKDYGGYVVHHSNDTVFVTYFNKSLKQRIALYCFANSDLSKPFRTNHETTALTGIEQELVNVKLKIIDQLSDKEYQVSIPKGFNPNFVLVKDNGGFKLYMLMGTSESGIIPIGNDYLFNADANGNIENWKKFHSRIIPIKSKGPNGEKVLSSIHSHLKTTPYITATDICTFRLYAGLIGMEEFTVLCTETGKNYKYNIKTNKIEITEL